MIDDRFQEHPELMLPSNIPEDIFDTIYLQAYVLIHSMAGEERLDGFDIDFITNIVSDILRIHDIYDMYKENISGLVVMYASWIILESLKRENRIQYKEVTFDKLFDNELLSAQLMLHNEAFHKKISSEVIK